MAHNITSYCEKCNRYFRINNFSRHYQSCGRPKLPKKIRGVDYDPNIGYKNGNREAWNKGATYEESYGKERSYKVKDKLSKARKDQPGNPHSEETKEKLSKIRIEFLETSHHVPWFIVGSIKVQGTWEKYIAECCIAAGLEIKRVRLRYDQHRTYTPDLFLPELNVYLEIKGWMASFDKEKYERVLQDHRDKNIRVILGKKALDNFRVDTIHELPTLAEALLLPYKGKYANLPNSVNLP